MPKLLRTFTDLGALLRLRTRKATKQVSYEEVQNILHYLNLNLIPVGGHFNINDHFLFYYEKPAIIPARDIEAFCPEKRYNFSALHTAYGYPFNQVPDLFYLHLSASPFSPKNEGKKENFGILKYRIRNEELARELLRIIEEKHNNV